jgi:hypothetical protein
MAAPHMAGAVALLWSLDPNLIGKIDETEQILLNSATPAPSKDCTGTDIEQSPNPIYGYGRLDILKAVETALGNRVAIAVNTSPARSGVITGGSPVIAGATVTLTATALPGYGFINWTENGIEVSTDAIYVFTSGGNRNLVANFVLYPKQLWFPLVVR